MAAETTMADLLAAVAALRLHVAAVDCPDEGMRGTAADAPKLAAAADPATCHTLAAALTAAAGDPSPAGEELCEVMDDLSGQSAVGSHQGMMGIVTRGILQRGECMTHGVYFGFAPFISDEVYWEP